MSDATILLTYRYRLLPTRGQHRRLRDALEHTRQLQNAALEERIEAYRKKRLSLTYTDQCRGLTEYRQSGSAYAVAMERWPLKKVDLAFRAFFRRLKSGEKPGFPRFRGRDRHKTFGFSDRDGWAVLHNGCLRMQGIGAIQLHMHRPLPNRPIACKIKRDGSHWYALLTVEAPVNPARQSLGIGIDVGISHLATLSNGEHIANPRHAQRAAKNVRRAARALARCRLGSRSRQKAKAKLAILKRREADTRSTHLHQITANLAGRFSTIVVERLAVKSLTRSAKGTAKAPGRSVRGKAGLNRALHDAAFGQLKEMLRYKAERAGGRLIEVDPRHTSQACSACGVVDAESRRSQARFECTGCGHTTNADWNAAINIARLGGVVVPSALNLEVA